MAQNIDNMNMSVCAEPLDCFNFVVNIVLSELSRKTNQFAGKGLQLIEGQRFY